ALRLFPPASARYSTEKPGSWRRKSDSPRPGHSFAPVATDEPQGSRPLANFRFGNLTFHPERQRLRARFCATGQIEEAEMRVRFALALLAATAIAPMAAQAQYAPADAAAGAAA